MIRPPSTLLKEFYQQLGQKEPTEAQIETIAKKTLLPVSEVIIWLQHLKTVDTNRKRGAAKAAETRRQKRAEQVSKGTHNSVEVYCCGICGVTYGDSNENE